MPTRTIIATIVVAAIIMGVVLLFDHASAPTNREEATQEEDREEVSRVVPAEWQRYEHESLLFTVDYPLGWTHRVETDEPSTVSFMPPRPAPQEVELNPRIILKIIPLVNILGAYKSSDAWFDAEVVKNPERWGARVDTTDGNPRYTFTEGVGEYPHENIIIMHDTAAYWFTIEASDDSLHELLPQIAASLQFTP